MTDSFDTLRGEALLAHMRGRRSIRRFTSDPVPGEVLARVVEGARWAPSAHNRQPWRFVVLTEDADQVRLADAMGARLAADLRADGVDEALIEKDTARSRARLTGAAALIVVNLTMADMDKYTDSQRQHNEHVMAIQSVAMAAQNMLLMIHAEGLAGVWMCAPLFCGDVVREVLDLPRDYEPQGIIALGYAAEEREKDRQPMELLAEFR